MRQYENHPHHYSHGSKRGEPLVSMFSGIRKGFDTMGDESEELFTENIILKNKITECDKKWFAETTTKQLKDINDAIKTKLLMAVMKKHIPKSQTKNEFYKL